MFEQITLEQFKTLAKRTGLPVNCFFYTSFFSPPCYVAENQSKKKHVSISYPNRFGGATLVTGWGDTRKTEFFESMEQLISEMEHRT